MNNHSPDAPLEFDGLQLDVARSSLLSDRLDYGECLAVVGPSGSGKSQLLSCLAGLKAPRAGSIRYYGRAFSDSRTRRKLVSSLGIAFQHSGLIHSLTVLENVILPYRCRQTLGGERFSDETIEQHALLRLELLGLTNLAGKYPHEILEGERRSVAVARALAHGTRIILLEEPTLGMSMERRGRILELLAAVLAIKAVDAIVLFTADPNGVGDLPTRYLDLSVGPAPLSLPVAPVVGETPRAARGLIEKQ
ncbi:MAG TPA: ATP-binding cassette domain-containing protein [Terrimicrobiaceae bacterium]